ncbi:hypothetical protein ON058_07570 [Demequina sp. B12]|uniref:hypothetical protein n=1 Tax=Demequina sp. B12 TaxID=2992757 RepID=UPI00237A575B|nr:hypothetical protein [Demequina sp. B12]MDE0573270.1 hypothetical protein [Demequina sp. B12]
MSIAGAQLLAMAYGPLAYVMGLAGVAVALVLHLSVSLRFSRVARAVREGKSRPSLARASVRVGVLTAFAVAVAASALTWMVLATVWSA